MPPWRHLPRLGSNVFVGIGNLGLKGGAFRWYWVSSPGKALAGAVEAAPARVLSGESTSPSCSLSFCLGIALIVWWLWLPIPAMLSVVVAVALTARAQVKGYKVEPLLLYTDIRD